MGRPAPRRAVAGGAPEPAKLSNAFIVNTDGGSDSIWEASRVQSVTRWFAHRLREQHPAQRGWKLPDSLRHARPTVGETFQHLSRLELLRRQKRVGQDGSDQRCIDQPGAGPVILLSGFDPSPVGWPNQSLNRSISSTIFGRGRWRPAGPTAMPRISWTTATTTMKRRRLREQEA